MSNNNTLSETPSETQQPQSDPVEDSAFFINQAHTNFKQLSYGLADRKKRSVARVLEAVLFEPLEQVELFGKEEKQLFDICQQIMYHKGTVLKYAYEKAAEKVKKGEVNE